MMDQSLNYNHIAVFCAAARHSNFSAAARELGISRAAVSKTIGKLEEQLGVPLFERRADSLSLSPEGALLFRRVNPSVSRIVSAVEELARSQGQPYGAIRIGVDGLLSRYYLHDFQQLFARKYPGIKLFLYKMTPSHLIHALGNGLVELGVFCVIANPFPGSEELLRQIKEGGFHQHHLESVTDCLVGGPRYLDYAGKVLTFDDLQKLPLILPRIEFQSADYYFQQLRKDGELYPFDLPVSGADSRVSLAQYNHGITYFPEQLLQTEINRGELLVLDTTIPMRRYDFLALTNRTLSTGENAKLYLRELVGFAQG